MRCGCISLLIWAWAGPYSIVWLLRIGPLAKKSNDTASAWLLSFKVIVRFQEQLRLQATSLTIVFWLVLTCRLVSLCDPGTEEICLVHLSVLCRPALLVQIEWGVM